MTALLSVRNLSVHFDSSRSVVRAVDDLSFDIGRGETVAIVGESGSGKSTAAMGILRLIPSPPGKIASGEVRFEDRDLLKLPDREIRQVRGAEISMIFQDPMMALNPVYTVGRQISEALMLHVDVTRQQARERSIELLRLVRVPAPETRVDQYPHNLSGGMRQRVMIAMALACKPKLLIADEPTTALDVTVQAQVLQLIKELKAELGMAVLLITHDLGVVAETADRVVVMYAGGKVEEGPARAIFRHPRHPYTQGLIEISRWQGASGGLMPEIPGTVPSPADMPPGCPFAPRCAHAMPVCRAERPALRHDNGLAVACFLAEEKVA